MDPSALAVWNGDRANPVFDTSNLPRESTDTRSVHSWYPVAVIARNISAHNPHRGKDFLWVSKAKSSSNGECTLIPIGWPPPPTWLVDWNLHTILGRENDDLPWPFDEFLYLPTGYASYPRDGYPVEWPQNPTGNMPGTQVIEFLHRCLNGNFQNLTMLWLDVPRPWSVPNLDSSGSRQRTPR